MNIPEKNERLALAMCAGAWAIEQSKRLYGATHCYDVSGKYGGPQKISYYEAAQLLWQEAEAVLGEEEKHG